MVGKATSIAWSRSVPSEHAYPLIIENLAQTPGMGVSGCREEALRHSEISTKNSSRVGWALSRHPVVNQPRSALPPESGPQQLVTVLAFHQLSQHC
jgi:hypothetical protein